jgi:hypothetical protein
MKFLKGALWLLAAVNVWIFSRFTVDDSFITWRYGYNLVHHGIWNYNPSTFDPTQAYTNPIYAIISIVPALFGINVVLFFKLLSLAIGAAFIFIMVRKRPDSQVWLALFFAVPATAIHLFSGLETFLYVVLMFAVFVAVMERRVKLTLVVTSLLFLTRPESWLLLVLVPLVLAVSKTNFNWKLALKSFLVLANVLGLYFLVTYGLFGEILPNTYYVKSGKELITWRFSALLWELALLIPLALLRHWRMLAFTLAFAIPVIYDYSTANLAMDFASRYAFHLYAPFALLVIYIYSDRANRLKLREQLRFIPGVRVVVAAGFVAISVGFSYATFASDLIGYESYYPRLVAAHGAVGDYAASLKAKGELHAMAMSDAGIGPYRADVSNLDALGLGTHIGATEGVSAKLIETYGVDFAAITGTNANTGPLKFYLIQNGFTGYCTVYMKPDYTFTIWSKRGDDVASQICETSKKVNDFDDLTYFQKDVTRAPWSYWY